MRLNLTDFQRKLINALQNGLPLCWSPFTEIAADLGSNEEEVLRQIRLLQGCRIIRRITALINHRAIGVTSTLVTAHVPAENIQEVAAAINAHESVSHNYLRDHHYNLWFTLQTRSTADIDTIVTDLSKRFSIAFHSLPAKRVFKLDVRFDAENKERDLLQNVQEVPNSKAVELNREQKLTLSKLPPNLELTTEPFDMLCSEGLQRQDVLRILKELIDKGVIRRIAAVVDHRKLGFVANALFVCEVPQDRVIQAGNSLAEFRAVSHCYERETFKGWPYNLFAMMHGWNMDQIQYVISIFVETERLESFELLPTTAKLKKQPIGYRLD